MAELMSWALVFGAMTMVVRMMVGAAHRATHRARERMRSQEHPDHTLTTGAVARCGCEFCVARARRLNVSAIVGHVPDRQLPRDAEGYDVREI